MRRRFAVTALVALVLVAGCVGGPSEETSTATPTPTATETTTAAPSYPTGFGPDGVTNASAAASAHADALLASDGFTFAFNATRRDGGERRGVYLSRVDLTDRQVLTYVHRPDTRYVQFYGDGVVYENLTQNGETKYASQNATIPLNGTTGRSTVAQLLGGVEYGSPERVDGGFRYGSERLVDARGIVGVDRANVSSFEAAVVVGEDGVVRSITYESTYTQGGQQFTVTGELATSKVGSTDVERPDWTAKA
ncbi:MAG: hypothetical protein ABEJ06_00040 [Haloarculaceae archaeon]